ncbi:MAG: hypothetical protein KF729_15615 [Sandaracinaceae bacterium]|nr:hypothetical protein [Sandaracinaceae bacterium]
MTRGAAALLWLAAHALVACGGGDASPGGSPAASAEPEAAEAPREEAAEEVAAAAALARAEAFARAQGYLDTPATATGDALVREGIEGTIADRRGTLRAPPLRAMRAADGWRVVFAYADARYEGRGRMLRLPDQGRPSFVHQDLLLDALAPR